MRKTTALGWSFVMIAIVAPPHAAHAVTPDNMYPTDTSKTFCVDDGHLCQTDNRTLTFCFERSVPDAAA